jgi:hypothetical protein
MDDPTTQMKLERDATLTNLTEKLGKLDAYVSGTVESVTDTVQSARDSVDIKLQVRRRPWTLVAGAVALGFVSGYRARPAGCAETKRNGAANAAADRRSRTRHTEDTSAARRDSIDSAGTGVSKEDFTTLHPEIARLKSFALGLIAGLAREALIRQVSRPEKSSNGSRADNHQGAIPGTSGNS